MISIIVPVYNSENTIRKCLGSILAQTYKDWECLVVNDGSTDSSGRIGDEYALKDNRFRICHKENGGVGSARNLGLMQAKGEWIAFVDSDDYVSPHYLSDLYKQASNGADMVINDYSFISTDGHKLDKGYSLSLNKEYDESMFKAMLDEQFLYLRTGPVAKLFKSEIIIQHRLQFPISIGFGEDTCFFFRYMMFTRKVYCATNTNYFYIDVKGSAINKKWNFRTEYIGYKYNKDAIIKFLEKCGALEDLAGTYLYWISVFLHRAITSLANKEELNIVTNEDWDFFHAYFKPISTKTKVDMYVINKYHNIPFVILNYLRLVRLTKKYVLKCNLWKVYFRLSKFS